MSKFILVYVTCASFVEAKNIAKHLLEKKLIACANVFKEVSSFYEWQGQMQESSEAVVILKTEQGNFKELQLQIQKIHSYECPCILELEVSNLNTAFANFIENALRKT